MTTRYHLHLAVPFVILIGAAVPALMARAGRWALPVVLVALASSFLHLGFMRDVEFSQMQEYRFAQEAARKVPDGCWVMEPVERDGIPFRSRLRRVSDEISGGVLRRRFSLVLVDPEDPNRLWIHRSNGMKEVEDLSRDRLMEEPPPCLYFYQGLRCFTASGADGGLPPGCIPPDLGVAVPVASDAFPFRAYDVNNELAADRNADLFRPALLRIRGGQEETP